MATKKGYHHSEFSLTLTMVFTLLFSFCDFISDFIYVFFTQSNSWIIELRLAAILLFSLQILVQLFSITGALSTLKKRFNSDGGEPYMNHIFALCQCLRCFLFELIAYAVYGLLVAMLSVVLGLTKLLSIKQVQHWWLSWMIVDYKQTMHDANKKLTKLENKHKNNNNNNNNNDSHTNNDKTENDDNENEYIIKIRNDTDMNQDNNNNTTKNDNRNRNKNDNNDNKENGKESKMKSKHVKQQSSGFERIMEFLNNTKTAAQVVNEFQAAQIIDFKNPKYYDNDTETNENNKSKDNNSNNSNNSSNNNGNDSVNPMITKSVSLNVETNKVYHKEIVDENNRWYGYEVVEDSLIWKIWLWIDHFTPIWMLDLKIDAHIYNSYFMTELIVESLPQLVLNAANSYYTHWTTMGIISATFSGTTIAYSMFKFIYYVGYLNKDLKDFVL